MSYQLCISTGIQLAVVSPVKSSNGLNIKCKNSFRATKFLPAHCQSSVVYVVRLLRQDLTTMVSAALYRISFLCGSTKVLQVEEWMAIVLRLSDKSGEAT